MHRKAMFVFPVVLTLLLGCSPTSQERKDLVQCSSGLKETFLNLQIAISAEPNSSTNSVARILGGIRSCPVTEALYMANPDLGKSIDSDRNGDEVAIYCPDLHYKAIGQTRYAAITFAGALVRPSGVE